MFRSLPSRPDSPQDCRVMADVRNGSISVALTLPHAPRSEFRVRKRRSQPSVWCQKGFFARWISLPQKARSILVGRNRAERPCAGGDRENLMGRCHLRDIRRNVIAPYARCQALQHTQAALQRSGNPACEVVDLSWVKTQPTRATRANIATGIRVQPRPLPIGPTSRRGSFGGPQNVAAHRKIDTAKWVASCPPLDLGLHERCTLESVFRSRPQFPASKLPIAFDPSFAS